MGNVGLIRDQQYHPFSNAGISDATLTQLAYGKNANTEQTLFQTFQPLQAAYPQQPPFCKKNLQPIASHDFQPRILSS
jgi:hypothetical protein